MSGNHRLKIKNLTNNDDENKEFWQKKFICRYAQYILEAIGKHMSSFPQSHNLWRYRGLEK